jgi:tetratricopeptide (TPR) repeat protein
VFAGAIARQTWYMLGGRSASGRREVVRLAGEGQLLHAQGDLAAAIDRLQGACALVREVIEEGPQDPGNTRQLASMLYTLGEWMLEREDLPASVEALDEAEALYRSLGEQAAQQAADVVIRRALVHSMAGKPLSAVADAQQAVSACLGWDEDEDVGDAERLDHARVVAWAGFVQLQSGGDPDLAVSAADWALQIYLDGLRVGDELVVPAGHATAFRNAAWVATVVHTAAERRDLADTAHFLLRATNGDTQVDIGETVTHVRTSQPTLAQVLGYTGRRDLAQALTAPAIESQILVPAMRCPPQLAPAYAKALGDLQGRVSDREDVLLGLEAHALFATASRLRVPTMRYRFGEVGPSWAAAVLNLGQRMIEFGEAAAAVDAADWLTAIIGQLAPYTVVADSIAHSTAMACSSWQHAIYTAVGDTAAASRVAQVIETLHRP